MEATFHEIPYDECLVLLGTKSVGRLAVPLPTDAPLVVPINYAVDGSHLVFRTGHGTKLRALHRGAVSFQVDEIDPATRTGWSVLVRGRAREVSGRAAGHVGVDSWVSQDRRHWVRLEMRSVTGRRIERSAGWAFDEQAYL
jgi:nitroimidazol reductase NimA-like FMN-containing flavoprotein (pyridoxamine 5'-phosphate oxidase superfamily)